MNADVAHWVACSPVTAKVEGSNPSLDEAFLYLFCYVKSYALITRLVINAAMGDVDYYTIKKLNKQLRNLIMLVYLLLKSYRNSAHSLANIVASQFPTQYLFLTTDVPQLSIIE
jgi:hypothetical protein